MKLKDWLKTTFLRAGVEVNNIDLEADIPELDSAINNILNVQLASKNNEVKNHFFQLFAKSHEAKIDKIIADSGLDISLIDSNGKRKPFNEQIETVLGAFSDSLKGKGDNPELSKTIADLTKQINEQKLAFENEKKAIHSGYSEKSLKQKIESHYLGLNFKAEIPESTRKIVAQTLFESKLSEKKGKVIERDGKLVLVNSENPDIPCFDENGRTVDFDELLKAATADIVQQGAQTYKTDPKPIDPPPPSKNSPKVGTLNMDIINNFANKY
jgi:hypothetical protein